MKKQNHIFTFICIVLLLSMALSACGQKSSTAAPTSVLKTPQATAVAELEGNITISGAFALYPMMQRWTEEYTKLHPKVLFDLSAGGAGKGMTDALAGAVDIGMVSRAITPEEEGKGAYWVAVAIDAVFATMNPKNPVLQDILAKGVSKETFIGIFITSEIKTWGQVVGKPEITDAIHVYTRSDSCGAADAWAKFLGNKKQEDLNGIGVGSDPALLDAVIKDPLGIGFNNLNYAFDPTTQKPVVGSLPVPIDANGNGQADPDEVFATKAEADAAIATGKYPAPPARAENLVTHGKSTGLVQTFILWILTDGQQFLGEAGYVQLPKDKLDASLAKIR